ncbi:MAG: radical SAM protein [Verrucomicrobiota bacterium]
MKNGSRAKCLHNLIYPADHGTRALLEEKWAALPEALRNDHQMYGRNEEGCGATIGLMPRCDFACRGCYLGDDANRTPADSLENIKHQMRELREYLGKWGNLQLTDGEITLRSEEEIVEILRYAREVELIPMIMTHGETFLRNPELLVRLIRHGGLREVSFHIDTTQRGRRDRAYRYAETEKELMPLRDEFADLIRRVNAETGVRLRAASTVTVDQKNLGEVSDIVEWTVRNSDAFRMISFQPMAQVGRTEDGSGDHVSAEALWANIEQGLGGSGFPDQEQSDRSHWWMGHPACSRFIFGYAYVPDRGAPTYRRFSLAANKTDKKLLGAFYKRWPGVTFRADSRPEAICRFLGMCIRAPFYMIVQIPVYLLRLLWNIDRNRPLRTMVKLFTKKSGLHRLTIASHHFMSRRQLETELGQERVKHCVFRVAHQNRMVSMCEFNAMGGREKYYDALSLQPKTSPSPST